MRMIQEILTDSQSIKYHIYQAGCLSPGPYLVLASGRHIDIVAVHGLNQFHVGSGDRCGGLHKRDTIRACNATKNSGWIITGNGGKTTQQVKPELATSGLSGIIVPSRARSTTGTHCPPGRCGQCTNVANGISTSHSFATIPNRPG